VKKDDDVREVIREEVSRGKKRPIDMDAVREQEDRRNAVLQILRRGTREQLRALLETWGYSEPEIAAILSEYDALRG
jgi:hypothetical protein